VTRLSQEVVNADNLFITAILAEALAVFLLCCVVLATGDGPYAGIGMGLAYAAGTLAIFAVTGASLNFARSLGPEVVMLFAGEKADWESFGRLGVYAAGGILGAALAGLLYPLWRPSSTTS
jgi:glycerol uptake facilitator-like aquaporin